MGAQVIPKRKGVIDPKFITTLRDALAGDLVPRNTSGVPAAASGSLGASGMEWLRCHIVAGHWVPGDIKEHHSYNGTNPIGHGWMLCDGRIVNQTNYDAEHGTGTWGALVGTSPLSGKYLPNFTNRFPVGVNATTQTGSAPITTVGTTNHTLNLRHNHKVFEGGPPPVVYEGTSSIILSVHGAEKYRAMCLDGPYTGYAISGTAYTDMKLSTSEDLSPDSIEVQFYMRII